MSDTAFYKQQSDTVFYFAIHLFLSKVILSILQEKKTKKTKRKKLKYI